MIEDAAPPRRGRGQALIEVMREDLDLYAVDELEERAVMLASEIDRTRAQMERKRSGRAAADALFKT